MHVEVRGGHWYLISFFPPYLFILILIIIVAVVGGGNRCAVVYVWRSKDNVHGVSSSFTPLHEFQVLNSGLRGQPYLPNEFVFWPSLPDSYFEKQSLAEPGACCFVDVD